MRLPLQRPAREAVRHRVYRFCAKGGRHSLRDTHGRSRHAYSGVRVQTGFKNPVPFAANRCMREGQLAGLHSEAEHEVDRRSTQAPLSWM
jgi:hypothetical protein